jgi:hypothetical protein
MALGPWGQLDLPIHVPHATYGCGASDVPLPYSALVVPQTCAMALMDLTHCIESSLPLLAFFAFLPLDSSFYQQVRVYDIYWVLGC